MKRYTSLEALIADGIIIEDVSPNCVETMQREFVEYIVGESLTCNYPVLEMFSNPRKGMQGGFISAAFDNTFGILVYFVTGQMEMSTIDLCINFHRPIFVNDILTVTTHIKARGKTIVQLVGNAYDSKKQLIASGTTTIYLARKK